MTDNPHIQDLIAMRRRTFLGALTAMPFLTLEEADAQSAGLSFQSLPPDKTDVVTVPQGYRVQTLIGWGDPLFENVAPFNPDALTRADQETRFGQNNDMLALFPGRHAFPRPTNQNRLLLCANHEYFDAALTFPAARRKADIDAPKMEALYAAMGVSVVQVEKNRRNDWRVIRDARPGAGLNRRITPFTPVRFEGPAKDHRWIAAASAPLATPDDAVSCGTMANCSGGQTPWGTYLSCEENFNNYVVSNDANAAALAPAQADAPWMWAAGNFDYPLYNARRDATVPRQFDIAQNPYMPALYGWVVEIDPYDPTWAPRKRTALGRVKHECATTALTRDGRVAVYMGDDQIDECVYKFVTRDRFDPRERTANRDLLNEGKLYVARFNEDGTGAWVALTAEAANAAAPPYAAPFADDGDVAIRAREAARFLGATPMDRPEDVEAIIDANWVGQGQVLVSCTYNRNEHAARPGNPRRVGGGDVQPNHGGHILKIEEAGGDCGGETFRWDVFALGGDPDAPDAAITAADGSRAYLSVKQNGVPANTGARFACPDNICFDDAKNVWIATDGSPAVFGDCNDSVLVTPTTGAGPRPIKRFLIGPIGCEICGPTVAPDQRAFLAAIQHPGEDDEHGNSYVGARWSDPDRKPPSSFPDGAGAWPRSAVVVVTRTDGGIVGT